MSVPSKLLLLSGLGLGNSICNWLFDFLTGRTQTGCCLRPLLYSLFTHDCVANSSIAFADDTREVGHTNISLYFLLHITIKLKRSEVK